MQKTTKLNNCIKQVSEIKNKYQLSPQQNRYVDKIVRERLKLQVPKQPRKLPDFLSPAEIWVLLKKAQNDSYASVLIEFLIFTGLRINEARNLMIEHIDFENNQLKVIQGKGAKDRYVPITTNLQSKIRLFLNGRQKGYVFAKPNQRQYTKRAMQYIVMKYINECNFEKKLSTHSLRHTFGTMCRSKGLKIQDIQGLMGHSSVKTTEIYAKIELGAVKDQFLQLLDNR